MRKADEVEIAVGYVSKAALKQLQSLVDETGIKRICLTIGMYYHEGMPFSAVIGSHNLGAIKLEASNLRQYELSTAIEEPDELEAVSAHVKDIILPKCSANISDLQDVPLIREVNKVLVDQEFVSKVTPEEVDAYKKRITEISFWRKRVWWEIEMVVSKSIRDLPGYPLRQKSFMAITDDGWKFQT